jgi:hypothetical protein
VTFSPLLLITEIVDKILMSMNALGESRENRDEGSLGDPVLHHLWNDVWVCQDPVQAAFDTLREATFGVDTALEGEPFKKEVLLTAGVLYDHPAHEVEASLLRLLLGSALRPVELDDLEEYLYPHFRRLYGRLCDHGIDEEQLLTSLCCLYSVFDFDKRWRLSQSDERSQRVLHDTNAGIRDAIPQELQRLELLARRAGSTSMRQGRRI